MAKSTIVLKLSANEAVELERLLDECRELYGARLSAEKVFHHLVSEFLKSAETVRHMKALRCVAIQTERRAA